MRAYVVNRFAPRAMACLGAGLMAGLGLLISGCGGSQLSSVSKLETTTKSATTTSVSVPRKRRAPVPRGSAKNSTVGGHRGRPGRQAVGIWVGTQAQGEKFVACMRAHGVGSIGDPNRNGGIRFNGDPASPLFQSARTACRAFWPDASRLRAMEAQFQASMLAFSKCMRSHGIDDFPDPTNGGQLNLNGGPGNDLNSTNRAFRRARDACQGRLPPGGEKELVPGPGL